MSLLDLADEADAYLFAFAQCDGHLSEQSRNRGRLSIELSHKDVQLLRDLREILNKKGITASLTTRTRNTNYKENYQTSCLNIFSLEFRRELIDLGFPVGKKSNLLKAPDVQTLNLKGYHRGLIDGDGSIGLSAEGIPFISFATDSLQLAKAFKKYIQQVTGHLPQNKRNQRDRIFNITLVRNNAQSIARSIYLDATICIDRKREQAEKVLAWQRETSHRSYWHPCEEERLIDLLRKGNPINEIALILQRKPDAVAVRRNLLYQQGKIPSLLGSNRWNAHEDLLLRSYLSQGLSRQEAATRLSKSVNSINGRMSKQAYKNNVNL